MDPELLAQILAAQSPQLSPLALAATQGGTSRTTLGQLTDPNILLGTGVADPSAIAYGLEQFLTSRFGEVSGAAQREYLDALERYQNDVAAAQRRYTIEPPKLYSEVRDRYLNVPQGVQDTFNQIESGILSAEQARVALTAPLSADELVAAGLSAGDAEQQAGKLSYKDVLQAQGFGGDWWERFSQDLSRFDQEAAQYRREILQFEDETARAQRELDAELTRLGGPPSPERFAQPFDMEAERLQYYKDIGLPGLALLPDPSATYQIPEEAMLARARRDRPSGQTLAEELLVGTVRQPRTELGTSGQVLTGGRPAATPVAAGRGTATDVVAPLLGAVTPQATRRQGGVPFTGASGRSAALQAALAPNMMTREQRIQQAAMRERQNAQLEAQATARGLARAGRTPFEDAMRALYGYGVAEARA